MTQGDRILMFVIATNREFTVS